IAFAEPHGLAAVRRHRDIAFQQVTNLLLVIMPRKLRHFLLPYGPTGDASLFEFLGLWIAYYLNVAHLAFTTLATDSITPLIPANFSSGVVPVMRGNLPPTWNSTPRCDSMIRSSRVSTVSMCASPAWIRTSAHCKRISTSRGTLPNRSRNSRRSALTSANSSASAILRYAWMRSRVSEM